MMREDNQGDTETAGPVEATDIRFMRRAIGLAREAARLGEVPVGAVVVIDGRLIGSGYNQPIASGDPTAHAEVQAIREAAAAVGNYRLSGATLYVTLEPCVMCAGAMVHARIDRLVYACRDPKSGAAGSLYDIPRDTRLNHRVRVESGIGEAEAGLLLRRFFQARRRFSGET